MAGLIKREDIDAVPSRERFARPVRHVEIVQLLAPDPEDDRPRALVAHIYQRQGLGVGGGVVGKEGFNASRWTFRRISCIIVPT